MPSGNAMQVSMSARYVYTLSHLAFGYIFSHFIQGLISNILEEDVVQPLLVSTSAIELSTETVCLLLKIDDYVQAR